MTISIRDQFAAAAIAASALFTVYPQDGGVATASPEDEKMTLIERETLRKAVDLHFSAPDYNVLAARLDKRKDALRAELDSGEITVSGITERAMITLVALNDVLGGLDQHSSISLDIEDANARIEGAFGGIGATVRLATTEDEKTAGIKIEELTGTTSPAAKAGLQAGDIITHIDGQTLSDKTLAQGIALLKGAAGTQVELTVQKAGQNEPSRITVTRGTIIQSPVKSRMQDHQTGYIAVSSFNRQTDLHVDEAIRTLQQQGATRFILDLRNNPGGLVTQAGEMVNNFMNGAASLETYQDILDRRDKKKFGYTSLITDDERRLLRENTLVSKRTRDGKKPEYFITKGALTDAPLVVLVNEKSASASEIVSGALQHYGRALVIGTQSYGKGTGQLIFNIDVDKDGQHDAAIRITNFDYYIGRGEGYSLQNIGITPDITLSATFSGVAASKARAGRANAANAHKAPDDANYTQTAGFVCRPATAPAAASTQFGTAGVAAADPWLDCAMAALGPMQTGKVIIEPANPYIATQSSTPPEPPHILTQ